MRTEPWERVGEGNASLAHTTSAEFKSDERCARASVRRAAVAMAAGPHTFCDDVAHLDMLMCVSIGVVNRFPLTFGRQVKKAECV